ncbi:hypothetical protein LJB89_02425 [Tyzzerella sp. OttesenSCG-928-J15]|nr:hypothetical protein [Tyzzerella sp. OttesenSCG-928-J15]
MKADDIKFQSEGYKNALGKIEKLVDSQSFSQIGAYVEGDNLVGGFATIDTRPYYIYCQYGPVNLNHAGKLSRIYKMAISMGAPVISILDSEGINVETGMDVLAAYGKIFETMSDASGVIPQYSLIYGKCMGTNAVISGLSDFSFGLKDSSLFIQSPNTAEDIKTVGLNKFLTATYNFEESGQLSFIYDDEDSLNAGFKEFLGFMPSNNLEETPILLCNEESEAPVSISAGMEVSEMVKAISDNSEFVEVYAGFAKAVKTYFARFDGFCAAVIANDGNLSHCAMDKLAKVIAFCDAFNIPVVTLTNVSGFETKVSSQKTAVSDVAALCYTFTNATVPKINIIVKDAIGLAGLAFNSKFIGADLVYSWPNANIALFTEEAAKVLGVSSEGFDKALAGGYVDEVIDPEETRKNIIYAIENLSTKRVFKHPKKHGSICF